MQSASTREEARDTRWYVYVARERMRDEMDFN